MSVLHGLLLAPTVEYKNYTQLMWIGILVSVVVASSKPCKTDITLFLLLKKCVEYQVCKPCRVSEKGAISLFSDKF